MLNRKQKIMSNYVSLTLNQKLAGGPTDYFGLDPVTIFFGSVAVSAQAPHPHAAVLFMDFLLSEEGQKILADRNVVPSNLKAQKLPVKLTLMDVPKYLDENAKWTRLYREIFVTRAR